MATPGTVLVQTPPVMASLSVPPVARQKLTGPRIGPGTAGSGLTVTRCVDDKVPQLKRTE